MGSITSPVQSVQYRKKIVQITDFKVCCNRVFLCILLNTEKDHTIESIKAMKIFPEDIGIGKIKEILECDGRFIVTQSQEEEEVILNTVRVTDVDRKLKQNIERWKDIMSSFFREKACDVRLCTLSNLISRPKEIPQEVNLVDVLTSDPQRRFLIINSNTPYNSCNENAYDIVKYKHTPAEVEYYHEKWRESIVKYLLLEPKAIPLVTLGTHVTKPKNLGKNQKLIDVVKADPKRFKVVPDPNHNSLTRIGLTEEYCKGLWRQQIHGLFSQKGRSKPVTEQEVLFLAPRPIPLRKSVLPRHVVDIESLLGPHMRNNPSLKYNRAVPEAPLGTWPRNIKKPQHVNSHDYTSKYSYNSGDDKWPAATVAPSLDGSLHPMENHRLYCFSPNQHHPPPGFNSPQVLDNYNQEIGKENINETRNWNGASTPVSTSTRIVEEDSAIQNSILKYDVAPPLPISRQISFEIHPDDIVLSSMLRCLDIF